MPTNLQLLRTATHGTPEPLTYTVRQVAALLGLSLGSAYTLVRDGTIPATRLGGRWVIPRTRFHTWLDTITDQSRDTLSATGTETYGRR
jgi:excisionase family DNA binding protein